MTKLASQIEDFLVERGAVVVGAAPAAAAADALKVHGRSLLEGAQSVICFGYPVPESILAAAVLGEALYWRAVNMLYRHIDIVALDAVASLEAQGHRSLPLFTCFPQYTERPRYIGAVQLVPVAVAVGLGALAKCGLLLSPQYGLRLLLGGILTTAAIRLPTHQPPLACPADCWRCIDACPVHAISRSGPVDHERCLRHSVRNPLLIEHIRNEALRTEYGFDLLLNTLGAEDHAMYTCIACVRACPKNYTTR
jgi:epoxyqueuosine reductase QueG